MKTFIVLSLLIHFSFPVKHSLDYYYIASSGVTKFPDFIGTLVLDGSLAVYCDGNKRTVEAKQDWMKRFFDNNPQHLDLYTGQCVAEIDYFKATIETLKERFNQTGGVHILQRLNGCEWDEETDEIRGFNRYGYDGEDLIAFDLEKLTWIALNPQADVIKAKWDADKPKIKYNENYLTEIFPNWLKEYLMYGRSSLQRTELPSVSLLQKTPSSPVTCHATGFYPDRAMMFWRKDGEEFHEDVDHGEILPNHDGTFQMSVDLNLSSVTPEDWRRYDCVFHLSGVEDDIVTRLDKAVIRSNSVPPSQFPAGLVIGVVVGLLLLTLCIAGLFIWRRLTSRLKPAETPDSLSLSSERNQLPTDHGSQ